MAHKFRYEFRDLLTNNKLEVLPLYGVNMNWVLATKGNNSYGDLTATYRSDLADRPTADVIGATEPGRTALWVFRDNVPIWAGIIWSRTYSSQGGGTYQIYAQTFDSYGERVIMTADETWIGDIRNIVRELWIDTAALGAQWNIGLRMPALFTTNLSSLTKSIVGNEQVVMGDLSKEMIEYGVEYRLLYGMGNDYRPFVSMEIGRWDGAGGAPPVGTFADRMAAELTYPGTISNYWITDSASKGATHLYGIGKGTGPTTPRGTVTNAALIAAGYPGLGTKLNFRETETQALLDDRLTKAIPYYKVPIVSPTLKLEASAGEVFGTFIPGDYVYAIIDDPRRFQEVMKVYYRVMTISLSPNESGGEDMDFTIAQPSTMVGEG
jgi:hypothetical protein